MNRSLSNRLAKLEARVAPGKVVILWLDDGEDAEAETARAIADGRAEAGDRFVCVSWISDGRRRRQPGPIDLA